MNDLDRQIEEALDAEDRQIYKQLGEQNVFAQALSVYQGKFQGIAVMASLAMFAMFGGAVFAGWNFFQTSTDVEASSRMIEALAWGGLTWFFMTAVGFMKIWFWMRMESNRVLREIKRVELQLARLQSKQIA